MKTIEVWNYRSHKDGVCTKGIVKRIIKRSELCDLRAEYRELLQTDNVYFSYTEITEV